MKKVFIASIAVWALAIASCNSDGKKADAQQTEPVASAVMKFEQDTYDFGTIKEGEKVTHEFKFSNEGKRPLIIFSASASCGCTVPEYPTEPIAPGESAAIKVVFNSEGKSGEQKKVVTISTNAETPTSQIFLEGSIQGK